MGKKKATSWKEARRQRAWALYQSGWKQKEIAEALGVTKGAISQWIRRGKEGGEAALKDRPKSGAPRRLSTEERQRIPGRCRTSGRMGLYLGG